MIMAAKGNIQFDSGSCQNNFTKGGLLMDINNEKQAKTVEIEVDKAPKNNYERLSGYADSIKAEGQQNTPE
jgi:hypothetical protein